jgi:hypothetical protein
MIDMDRQPQGEAPRAEPLEVRLGEDKDSMLAVGPVKNTRAWRVQLGSDETS